MTVFSGLCNNKEKGISKVDVQHKNLPLLVYIPSTYTCSCYLNPATSFTWSFIAPVVLILLANIGFFIMAVVIMFRHHKRQHSKSRAQRMRYIKQQRSS